MNIYATFYLQPEGVHSFYKRPPRCQVALIWGRMDPRQNESGVPWSALRVLLLTLVPRKWMMPMSPTSEDCSGHGLRLLWDLFFEELSIINGAKWYQKNVFKKIPSDVQMWVPKTLCAVVYLVGTGVCLEKESTADWLASCCPHREISWHRVLWVNSSLKKTEAWRVLSTRVILLPKFWDS